jgi:hypothetical protein
MILSFLFPANVDSIGGCGLEGGKEPAGKCPPPDSDPFSETEFAENLSCLSSQFAASASGRFQFNKRSQLFVATGDKPLSVVAMRVTNPDRSPFTIES